jgi:hypothetical protein
MLRFLRYLQQIYSLTSNILSELRFDKTSYGSASLFEHSLYWSRDTMHNRAIGVQFPTAKRDFPLNTTARLALGPIQPLIQLIRGDLPSGVTRRNVKLIARVYLVASIPLYVFMILSTGNTLILLVEPIIGVVNWRKV